MNDKKLLIAGLGNIGTKYDNTRHNVGFMCLDGIQRLFNLNQFENSERFKSLVSTNRLENGLTLILAKPTTFMNLSGIALSSIINYYKIDTENLTLIHDDLDIAFGSIKIHQKNPKSHNGVNSVKKYLQNNDLFTSIRIGIDNRSDIEKQMPSMNYVLSKFRQEEIDRIESEVFPKIFNYTREILDQNSHSIAI
jgi:peptidyl-tRNA hydrolase, PTH1 family